MAIEKKAFQKKIAELKDAYYNGHPLMSDIEYDKLIQSYKDMFGEDESVGSPVPSKVQEIKKVKHKFPAKSLDKTKDVDKLVSIFDVRKDGSDEAVVMWKLDGSTVQLTYFNGKLLNAATRGDGLVGQDITHNAPFIKYIPQTILSPGLVTVRGEAIMSYETFDKINSVLPDEDKYENPRNLANASITMKNPSDMKDRGIEFIAFELVYHENMSSMSFTDRFQYLMGSGFHVVDFNKCTVKDLKSYIDHWSDNERIKSIGIPVDGLVVAFEDAPYSDKLPGTEHHPNPLHGFALKWADEEKETILREIKWQPSRTGLLNPVAVFDPVRLEGTTVERASLHNFSIMRNLHIRIGDKITVYKANKIIPQIAANLSDNASPYTEKDLDSIIGICPVCGHRGVVKVSENKIESVYCENPHCKAKLLDRLVHFCSRYAMDITGLSEATLSKFIDRGYISEYADIYELNLYKYEILSACGFGDKSFNNLWNSIQKSREVEFVPFITALGIPGIGSGQAKYLKKTFKTVPNFLSSHPYDYTSIETFGPILSKNLNAWMEDKECAEEVKNLMQYMIFKDEEETKSSSSLEGKTFVVTGKVSQFPNRDAIHKFIEDNGGKISGSVTSKTSYLVNNDIESTSGKNKKAKELGIPIISEEDLIKMVG